MWLAGAHVMRRAGVWMMTGLAVVGCLLRFDGGTMSRFLLTAWPVALMECLSCVACCSEPLMLVGWRHGAATGTGQARTNSTAGRDDRFLDGDEDRRGCVEEELEENDAW